MQACERIATKDVLPPWVFEEHLARYRFAARFVKGKTVIDCACGEGDGTEIFLQEGAAQIVACDTSASALRAARQKVGSAHVSYHLADAQNLPLPDESADVFISLETIEHLEDDERYLSEIQRILRADGLLVCSTPNRSVTNPGTGISDRPWNPYHVREYTEEEFEERLRQVFEQVDFYGQYPTHPWVVTLMAYVSRTLSRHAALKFSRMLKFPRRLRYHASRVAVQPRRQDRLHECLVAVCRSAR